MESHKHTDNKKHPSIQNPSQNSDQHKDLNKVQGKDKNSNQDHTKISNKEKEGNIKENPNQNKDKDPNQNQNSSQNKVENTNKILNPAKDDKANKIPSNNNNLEAVDKNTSQINKESTHNKDQISNDNVNKKTIQNNEEDEFVSKMRREMLSDLKYTMKDNKISSDFLSNIDKIPYCKYSLCSSIAKNDPYRNKANKIFLSCYDSDSDLQNLIISRSLACFYGMLCGDSIGSFFEFKPVCQEQKNPITDIEDFEDKRGGNFKLLPGQWTDDSSMGLCLADSLIFNNGKFVYKDIMQRFIAWCHCGLNNAFKNENLKMAKINMNKGKSPYYNLRSSIGLGGNISLSFKFFLDEQHDKTRAGDTNTSGNGSLMRLAPIPIYYYSDPIDAAEKSGEQSLITHQGTEAYECCKLMGYIIASAINHPDPIKTNSEKNKFLDDTIKKYLPNLKIDSVKLLAQSLPEKNLFRINEDRNWNWKNKEYCFSNDRKRQNPGYYGSYAMDGMCMALHCVWNTCSAKDAILKAANMRGDADTVAAIAGQISGAIFGLQGLPQHWIEKVNLWDDGDGIVRVYRLINKKFMDLDGNEVNK